MLRFLSAGESHGPCLLGIIEGMPAGLPLTEADLIEPLRQRQSGYGRGERMAIESDRAEILSGVSDGLTTGAPIALRIENRDWANRKEKALPPLTVPRPGHADLPGYLKYQTGDMRVVLERASARETAMRVAIGAVAACLLDKLGVRLLGHVCQIGSVVASQIALPPAELRAAALSSAVRCPDPAASEKMVVAIEQARAAGDSLGGRFVVQVWGAPPGLGSHVHWDRRLDGRLAQAIMSIPAVKGVEIGLGFTAAGLPGSQVHDELFLEHGRLARRTNNAGGLEGGMSNGETIVLRAAMKPIPTLLAGLNSVDVGSRQPARTVYQRSDVCAVPAASVVGEVVVAWELAAALLEQYGGDTLVQVKAALGSYLASMEDLWRPATSS